MAGWLPGFPRRFPVRDDGKRPWRYRIVSWLARVVLRAFFGRDLRFDGMERFPLDGPLLVVTNHLSNVDPFLFGAFAPGTMFCMAKRELYRHRAIAWILAGSNCFPVDRGTADRWALRTALDVLAKRGRLLIFLEGTRAKSPGMKRAEAGVGFLARRSGARVLPIAIWGTERSLPRGRRLPRRVPVNISVGEPFVPAEETGRTADQQVADAIGRRIAQLLPQEYRGVYG
jgi:1-acyl-sn-glycerol-3-phosphate acyltransferase